MNKSVQVAPVQPSQAVFSSDPTDSAILHLDGAQGLLWLMQTSLEPTSKKLSEHETVGMITTVQSLIKWARNELAKDQKNCHDWANVMLWLDGIHGALCVLSSGYLGDCDLPNHQIQIATLHSLQAVIHEVIRCLSHHGGNDAETNV